jgi:hypothetical protein
MFPQKYSPTFKLEINGKACKKKKNKLFFNIDSKSEKRKTITNYIV